MSKTSKGKISAVERRSEALNLRRQGFTLRAIADSLNVSVGTVFADIKESLAILRESHTQSTEEWVTLELERLDMATVAIAQQVQDGNLKAIDRWLKLMERRARLLGLDKAPQPTMDVLTAFKVLAENGILPPQMVSLVSEELGRVTTAIAQSISGCAQ